MPRSVSRFALTPRALAACVLLAALLPAGCAGVPSALAPVPAAQHLPARPPDDAAFAVRALLGRIQGAAPRGAGYAPEAAAALDRQPFAYPGFRVAAHSLLRYAAPPGAPQSRTASGRLVLADAHGRVAGLAYDVAYHLADGALVLDRALTAPVYRRAATVRAFLVPKDRLPPPAPTWEEAYATAGRLDAMPPGGLRTPHLLGTHALLLFVMERLHPEADLHLDIPIPEVAVPLDQVRLRAGAYADYDGWRVAVVVLSPGLTARAAADGGRKG
ncbi:hypothetical protein [Desulfocurvus sp.]|uniref:hypothetical protein n=1 Tax=Desulfocurvus sp. TaxID=2871698 RepID=UPI0025C399D4|nr:hypothetical protein [Desulfocurvus sp.]MCK9240298.1 hypothetical protein [Desulfocurvus sp.]